jgi:hypothetical protein
VLAAALMPLLLLAVAAVSGVLCVDHAHGGHGDHVRASVHAAVDDHLLDDAGGADAHCVGDASSAVAVGTSAVAASRPGCRPTDTPAAADQVHPPSGPALAAPRPGALGVSRT